MFTVALVVISLGLVALSFWLWVNGNDRTSIALLILVGVLQFIAWTLPVNANEAVYKSSMCKFKIVEQS